MNKDFFGGRRGHGFGRGPCEGGPKGMGWKGRGGPDGEGCRRDSGFEGQGPCRDPQGIGERKHRHGPHHGMMGCRKDGPMGGPMGGMRRMGRLFDHGSMRHLILMMIAEKPRHGYEIIKAIEEKVGGAYAPSPGLIYPTLSLLEEMGLIAAQAGDNKKLYSLTPEGQAHLNENAAQSDALQAKMEEIRAAQSVLPPPELIRAMENLRLAMHLRLSRGGLEPGQAQSLAAALDALALQVEKA